MQTSSFIFEHIDLDSIEAIKLIQRKYTKKQTGEKRFDSMLHFLSFSCMCSRYTKRRSTVFLEHVIHTYNKQNGKCAISGVPLRRPLAYTHCDSRFFASIDRIDNDRGYEVGNIRLTLQWVNHALGGRKCTEDLLTFGSQVLTGRCLETILSIQKYKLKSEVIS